MGEGGIMFRPLQLICSVGMNLNRRGLKGVSRCTWERRGGWLVGVEGAGSRGFLLWTLCGGPRVSQVLSQSATYPCLGKHPH